MDLRISVPMTFMRSPGLRQFFYRKRNFFFFGPFFSNSRSIISAMDLRISVPMTFMRSPGLRQFFYRKRKLIRKLNRKLIWSKVSGKFHTNKSLEEMCKYPGMNEFWPSLTGTSQFVHSFVHFVMSFSVIIQWQHGIWYHASWYELLGPWPIFPPSFIEISWKLSEISPLSNYYCGDSNYY